MVSYQLSEEVDVFDGQTVLFDKGINLIPGQ